MTEKESSKDDGRFELTDAEAMGIARILLAVAQREANLRREREVADHAKAERH